MDIVTAFELGLVEDFGSVDDLVIDTVLSKLFFSGDFVYKAYKHRNSDFGDLSHPEFRKTYHEQDFYWNNLMSPEVYVSLHKVSLIDGYYRESDGTREDYYVKMKKIDTRRDLTKILESAHPLLPHELESYVVQITEKLDALTRTNASSLQHFLDLGREHVFDELRAVESWAHSAREHLSSEDIKSAMDQIQYALDSDSYFQNLKPSDLSVVIDTNPDNVLFLEEGVVFIDVMPPKENWRVHDRYFVVCRTSSDLSAYQRQQDADQLHTTYGAYAALPSSRVRMVYELASALIQVPYRVMLGAQKSAEKYASLVRSHTKILNSHR